MQTKDISDKVILEYLADRQGSWTCNWGGHFESEEYKKQHPGEEKVEDIFFAFPKETPPKIIQSKMKSLIKRGLSGGCDCGCRGDFEITDKGLELIGRERTKPYNGY